jgi:hypothetical protein
MRRETNMEAPAILKLPEQKMVIWCPMKHAERLIRKHGGEILEQRIAGLDKNMEPVIHYMVLYNRPRFTGLGA